VTVSSPKLEALGQSSEENKIGYWRVAYSPKITLWTVGEGEGFDLVICEASAWE